MPRITLKNIEDACQATIPELERASNWYGHRADGFPWRDLATLGRAHLPGVGWLRTVETFRIPGTDVGRYGTEGMIDVIIFKVDEDVEGKLFRKIGWYNSWDVNSYNGDLDIVERYEKVVIDYRKVD